MEGTLWTLLPSMVEAELEADGGLPSISLGKVTEVVKQLHSGKAPGIDEIRPPMLKAMGVEGMSWMTCLFNIAWESGTVPKKWQTGVVVSLVKIGELRVCADNRVITHPGKAADSRTSD